MKKKNLLCLLLPMLMLSISSCEQTTSKWDGSCGKCGYSVNHDNNSDSKDAVKSFEPVNFSLQKGDDGLVKLIVTGRATGYTLNDTFYWTWQLVNSEGTVVDTKNLSIPVNQTNNFSSNGLAYVVSNLDHLPNGAYYIYGGINENELENYTPRIPRVYIHDLRYKYYVTDTNSESNCIFIEQLPEFVVSEVSVVKNPNNHIGLYLKVGGEQGYASTITSINSWNTIGAFQNMSPYEMLDIDDAFWVVENMEAYYYMSVDDLELNMRYLTHLDLNVVDSHRTRSKLVPLDEIKENNVFSFKEEGVEFEIKYTIPKDTPVPGEEYFFGGLGVICRRPTEPFMIKEASIVKNPESHNGYYLKIGGEQAFEYSIDTLNGWNTVAAFQQVTPYRMDILDNYFWSIDRGLVFLYLPLNQMQKGYDYFTLLDVDSPGGFREISKCLPHVSFLDNNIYTFADDNVEYEIHYQVRKTTEGVTEDDYYGALAIRVRELQVPPSVE